MYKYIGIAKEKGDPWYAITIMLYDSMIRLTAHTKKGKRPKCYWYNKEAFHFCINEINFFYTKWFVGTRLWVDEL